jgi:hypothetical protein
MSLTHVLVLASHLCLGLQVASFPRLCHTLRPPRPPGSQGPHCTVSFDLLLFPRLRRASGYPADGARSHATFLFSVQVVLWTACIPKTFQTRLAPGPTNGRVKAGAA